MITIGTDCSGIEAPVMALRRLRVPHKHLWSCDIDPYVRQSIEANYNPNIIFTDITKPRKLPQVDIYVAGFPCQSFSLAGSRLGIKDPRGTIFWDTVRAIRQSKPKVFILENVIGLLSDDNGNTFKTIIKTLDDLSKYDIYHKVLNSCDYGVPQNRKRVFIVGIHKRYHKNEFQWPQPKPLPPGKVYKLLGPPGKSSELTENYSQRIGKCRGDFCDILFENPGKDIFDKVPCITTRSRIYSKKLKRFLSEQEYLRLQGFPKSFKQVVSKTQFIKQIGNSMTVDVLMCLFKSIFHIFPSIRV